MVKHRSPRSIVREFLSTDPGGPDEAIVEPHPADPDKQPRTLKSMVKEITREGRWAFVRIYPEGEAELHWFVDKKQSPKRIVHLLGHELGHLTGKNLKNDRAEEYRADGYGTVALQILKILSRSHELVAKQPKAARSPRASHRPSARHRR